MKKQTAVEWLLEYCDKENWSIPNNIIDQAKKMERNQLILFGAQCMVESEKESGLGAIRIYELYFDKTFKSDEETQDTHTTV
jgi:hypothetical protein